MSGGGRRADWQLPPGVSRATWDYLQDPKIASEYDAYHADHQLLRFDQQLVNGIVDRFDVSNPARVLDLGCGTGRSLIHAWLKGHTTIGVDLSQSMLDMAKSKFDTLRAAASNNIDDSVTRRDQWLLANLVELHSIDDASIDLALCLYSSFGMVRGHVNRLKALRDVHRALKSCGQFVLHVHNRGNWFLTSAGRTLLVRDRWQRMVNREQHELGDRYYSYRGLPQMYLHIFSCREIRNILRAAGLKVERWVCLNQSSDGPLNHPRWLPNFRSAGFLIIASKS